MLRTTDFSSKAARSTSSGIEIARHRLELGLDAGKPSPDVPASLGLVVGSGAEPFTEVLRTTVTKRFPDHAWTQNVVNR